MESAVNAVARHCGRVFDHQVLWIERVSDLLPEWQAIREGAVS
jgi:hypothetical protein